MKERVLGILMLFVIIGAFAWYGSVPWRTFDAKIVPPAEIVQQGTISEIWIDADRRYVQVKFNDGTCRKCTISTVGLYRTNQATAIIGRINHGYSGWDHVAMDIGLPSNAYWRLRSAGWSPWRHQVHIKDLSI